MYLQLQLGLTVKSLKEKKQNKQTKKIKRYIPCEM